LFNWPGFHELIQARLSHQGRIPGGCSSRF